TPSGPTTPRAPAITTPFRIRRTGSARRCCSSPLLPSSPPFKADSYPLGVGCHAFVLESMLWRTKAWHSPIRRRSTVRIPLLRRLVSPFRVGVGAPVVKRDRCHGVAPGATACTGASSRFTPGRSRFTDPTPARRLVRRPAIATHPDTRPTIRDGQIVFTDRHAFWGGLFRCLKPANEAETSRLCSQLS